MMEYFAFPNSFGAERNLYQIGQIQSGDAVLYNNQLDQLVNAMAAFDPPAASETELSPQQREQLDQVLAVAWER